MSSKELVSDLSELEKIADLMANEIKSDSEDTVSRYTKVSYNISRFTNGKKHLFQHSESTFNREEMTKGIYSAVPANDSLSNTFEEATITRDLRSCRFNFNSKGIPLPNEQETFFEDLPSKVDFFDNELREFSKSHSNTQLLRSLYVEQKVIANSKGGKVIQSIPFFSVSYVSGYDPMQVNRTITAACNSEEEIKRFPELINYLADPTPDKRIRKGKNFTEAFDELYKISKLKSGSLEELGVPLSELYDVVMLTGVPVHEIFGHHFEEPINFLDFQESGTFRYGQNIQNKGIILLDNPQARISGFRVQGFTNFDAYGRKREQRAHIKDGKVVEFLGSEYADQQKFKQYLNMDKSEFVGNASQFNDGSFPQPRMSCTILDGPTEKIDLEGKILLVPNEGHTSFQDKTYRVNACEAYVVKGGEPKRVIPLKVTGGINQALANIHLLDDWTYNVGMCGKNDPLVSRHSAQNPVSQFTRSQLWKNQQVYPSPMSDKHIKILVNKN